MSPSWRSGSSHGPDCSSDLLLPQLLYAVADVPVVQVEQVHFSIVAQRQIPWSRLSVGPFSYPVNTVVDVPVVQVVQVHFPVGAQRQSPWSKLFV